MAGKTSVGPAAALGTWILICAATLAARSLRADEFTQKGVHEHGRAALTFALDRTLLTITLESPAVNVVGFEHPPSTDEERAAVSAARALLGAPGQLFLFPPAAACRVKDFRVTPPGWAAVEPTSKIKSAAASLPAGKVSAEEHADYDATYRFECARPAELGFVDALLVRKLRQIQSVRAAIATDAVQTERTLSAETVRVNLK